MVFVWSTLPRIELSILRNLLEGLSSGACPETFSEFLWFEWKRLRSLVLREETDLRSRWKIWHQGFSIPVQFRVARDLPLCRLLRKVYLFI